MLSVSRLVRKSFSRWTFGSSADYWQRRYASGGNSGAGSYNRLARFKADVLNHFVQRHDVREIVEFGSGDGAQLELADYPCYVGIDVAKRAVEATRAHFANDPTKSFFHSSEVPADLKADLTLSLDVIYHLVEDQVFEEYMSALFAASRRWVIVYSSNHDAQPEAVHVRHREFTRWVARHRPDFQLKERIANAFPFDAADPQQTSFADFYIFERS